MQDKDAQRQKDDYAKARQAAQEKAADFDKVREVSLTTSGRLQMHKTWQVQKRVVLDPGSRHADVPCYLRKGDVPRTQGKRAACKGQKKIQPNHKGNSMASSSCFV